MANTQIDAHTAQFNQKPVNPFIGMSESALLDQMRVVNLKLKKAKTAALSGDGDIAAVSSAAFELGQIRAADQPDNVWFAHVEPDGLRVWVGCDSIAEEDGERNPAIQYCN